MITEEISWLEITRTEDNISLETNRALDDEWLCRYIRTTMVAHNNSSEFAT